MVDGHPVLVRETFVIYVSWWSQCFQWRNPIFAWINDEEPDSPSDVNIDNQPEYHFEKSEAHLDILSDMQIIDNLGESQYSCHFEYSKQGEVFGL